MKPFGLQASIVTAAKEEPMTVRSPFFIRTTRPEDIPDCVAIDIEAWGADSAAPEAWLRERLQRYTAGNFVAIERATGRIVGTVWTVRMQYDRVTTWFEASGNGTYAGVYDPLGDTIFGVNHSVPPAYRGRKVGMLLATRVAEMAWMFGMRRAVFGCPVPEYHKWQHTFDIHDYVRVQRLGGDLYFRDPGTDLVHFGGRTQPRTEGEGRVDPRTWLVVPSMPADAQVLDGEVAYFMQLRVRGQPCKLFRALPGYFPDPDSCDNGVLIGWENDEHPDAALKE
jgi:hypothetical protein